MKQLLDDSEIIQEFQLVISASAFDLVIGKYWTVFSLTAFANLLWMAKRT